MTIWEIATNYYQYFLRGTRTTILISLLTVFCGSLLGCLIAFMRLSKFRPLKEFASIYITIIRGTPMLVQLYIVYYQLDFISYPIGTLFGVDLERALPCIIALSINSSAYVAEIIRAGIQAVDKGQMEDARSCGMTNVQATLRGDAAGGHKVGVQNGTIQAPIANELAGEENVVGLVKAQGLIMELKSGKLDVVYIDYTPSLAFAAANDDLLVKDIDIESDNEGQCIGVQKGNEDFVAYLNEKIAEMQEQGLIDQYVAEAQTLAGIG